MPISILMTKMIFIEYLPPARPKLVPNLKVPRIYWNGAVDISNIPISILKSKINFMKYLPPVRPKLTPKLNMLRIIEIWPT